MKKTISVLIRLFISIGLLALLFWFMRNDISDIWDTLAKSNRSYVSLAMGLVLLNIVLLGYRMKIIFLGENLNITLFRSIKLTSIGYFFNNFMPTAVGGDIIKAHYAARDNNESIKSYASVLMDRFIGLYTFLISAAIALIVDHGRIKIPAVRILVFCLLIVGVVLFFVATNKMVASFIKRLLDRVKMMKLGEKLQAIYDIVYDYRNRKAVVFHSVVVSILSQCVYFFMIYIMFLSVGAKIKFGIIFLIMPVVTFISMVPSIGGLGAREGAIVAFFSPIAGKEASFAVSILILFSLFFISGIGGIFYIVSEISRGAKKK